MKVRKMHAVILVGAIASCCAMEQENKQCFEVGQKKIVVGTSEVKEIIGSNLQHGGNYTAIAQSNTQNRQERRFGRGSSEYDPRKARVEEEITRLTNEQSEILSKIKKEAGGDSTIAYRAMLKSKQPELDKLGRTITLLKDLKDLKSNL